MDQEGKVRMLDKNIMIIAQDFEKFQRVISKVHLQVNQLMEVNADVLLGKKVTTCLSCNNGKEAFDKVFSVQGKDGKMYYGGVDIGRSSSQIRKSTREDYTSERTNLKVDFNLKKVHELNSPTVNASINICNRSNSPDDQ